jgi:hypothetical protein
MHAIMAHPACVENDWIRNQLLANWAAHTGCSCSLSEHQMFTESPRVAFVSRGSELNSPRARISTGSNMEDSSHQMFVGRKLLLNSNILMDAGPSLLEGLWRWNSRNDDPEGLSLEKQSL